MSDPDVSLIEGNAHAPRGAAERSVMNSRLSVEKARAADTEDQLSAALERFPLRAGVFHTGPACGSFDFDRRIKPGHFHLVRAGRATLSDPVDGARLITEPSVIFYPDARPHRLVTDADVELVCATVRFGVAGASPVVGVLPALVVVRLAEIPHLSALGALATDELPTNLPGRQSILNRLCELAIVAVLRHCIARGSVSGGALAGLADARLAKAIEAMHRQPECEWPLEELAVMAGMSRTCFATRFRETVHATPGDHLTACRMARAQQLLRQGECLKSVAAAVGYASASAFTRAFTRVVGSSPMAWLEPVDRA